MQTCCASRSSASSAPLTFASVAKSVCLPSRKRCRGVTRLDTQNRAAVSRRPWRAATTIRHQFSASKRQTSVARRTRRMTKEIAAGVSRSRPAPTSWITTPSPRIPARIANPRGLSVRGHFNRPDMSVEPPSRDGIRYSAWALPRCASGRRVTCLNEVASAHESVRDRSLGSRP
jgi:hypothetical protein